MTTSRFLFYGNGGSKNHGCEAITRSTCKIFGDVRFRVLTRLPEEDLAYGLDTFCDLVDPSQVPHPRATARFLKAYLALKLRRDHVPLDRLPYMDLLYTAKPGDVALSAGGDNYCYAREGAQFLKECRETLRRRGVKTVLWGCSVEPSVITGTVEEDLKRYDLIVARESISYEALKRVNPNTLLAPDPAFTLPTAPAVLPDGLEAPYIGINVSPLIQAREARPGVTMENFRALIRHILETTDRSIALIPHVVWSYNDDRIPLRELYEAFKDTGRVFLVEDQSCMRLKTIISGCEFFVGARTHATIAAYSTCVPTLVVGYSVKARGIARDLFGTEEDYVLPVQQLKETADLTQTFKVLYSRRDELRQHLSDMMPGYIAGIQTAKEAVEEL